MMLPVSRRYRGQTAELGPFWTAHGLYGHDPADADLLEAEWDSLGISPSTMRLLWRAGLTCYRVLPPCPDWLLSSVPGLGRTRLAEIRRILPYGREVYAGPLCPGRVIENARSLERLTPAGLDAYLAEQARREQAGEPELIGTEAVLARFDGGASPQG